jgi:hypothetical protein
MSFHENYDRGEIKPPTERSTGLVFAAVGVILAFVWRHNPAVSWIAIAAAVVFAALALISPLTLRPLNLFWFRLGLLLHKVVNPVIMFAMFAIVIIPGGLLMRIWRDPLMRRPNRSAATYWLAIDAKAHKSGSMRNQF